MSPTIKLNLNKIIIVLLVFIALLVLYSIYSIIYLNYAYYKKTHEKLSNLAKIMLKLHKDEARQTSINLSDYNLDKNGWKR